MHLLFEMDSFFFPSLMIESTVLHVNCGIYIFEWSDVLFKLDMNQEVCQRNSSFSELFGSTTSGRSRRVAPLSVSRSQSGSFLTQEFSDDA